MSLAWGQTPVIQRKEEVRIDGAGIYKRITHLLTNKQARDKSLFTETKEARDTHDLESARWRIKMQKESEWGRGTHSLLSTERGTSHDMENIQANEGHLRPGEHRRGLNSGHQNILSEWGALTFWKAQREGQVKMWKESKWARGTHILCGGRDRSGQGKNPNKRGKHKQRDRSGQGKNPSKWGALTA
jgi:hypothetical protein